MIYLKIILSYFFVKTGLIKKLIKRRQIILSYHNIIPDDFYEFIPHLGVSHAESVFKMQIEIINNYLKKNNIDHKLFLTFDDGFRNNYDIAQNYLVRIDAKCIFFISPKKRVDDEVFWIDKLNYFCSYLEQGDYEFFGKSITLKYDRFEFKRKVLKQVYANYNKKDDVINTFFLKASLLNHNCRPDTTYFRLRFNYMDEKEIEHLNSAKNFKIGYHTDEHDNLSLISKNNFLKELKIRSQFIKKYDIKDFAFPFGGKEEIDIEHLKAIKDSGMVNIYSNTEQFINKVIISRRSLPNSKNKYLILAYYANLFSYLKGFLFK